MNLTSCSPSPSFKAGYRVNHFALALLASSLFCCHASAATISFTGTSVPDGDPVSGTAEFTIDSGADVLNVKLTNTTTETLNAGQLFTGLDFSLGGLIPSLSSDTAIERDVDDVGGFSDGGSAVDISWSLVALGGSDYQLNFNPNARHAIIGPPDGGDYSTANGSIQDNNGHNPFAAEMAVFELSVPGLEDDTPISISTWRFGTTLNAATPTPDPMGGIPEPSTGILLLGLAGIAVWSKKRRST